MKILITTLILLFIFSFTSSKREFTPPGTVKINDTLFADETEISNLSWKEYEYWVKTKYGTNSEEHNKSKPDTMVWINKLSYNEPYVSLYHWHPAYRNYPVVGISYEQATAFCKWRTQRVKDFLSIAKKHLTLKFEYRLPTKQEWETLSYNGQLELSNNGRTEKKQMKMNICSEAGDTMGTAGYLNDNADVTAPVYSYWKNPFGLWNMIGNVSEMIQEKGISKGGSWRNSMEECRVGKDILYTKSEAWLGFRCVCVVKK